MLYAGGVVLGIKQQSGTVQGCDHFTWFRIPLADIAKRQLLKASGQG